jgi:hypothetical protein
MASSGMLRRVPLIRTDVTEELLPPSSPIPVTLMMETLSCSETPILTRATRRNIPADAILQRLDHLISYAVPEEDTSE